VVEREHQLCDEALPQRVLRNEPFECGHDLGEALERELGIDQLLGCRKSQLFEPASFRARKRLRSDFRKRLAAPEFERLTEAHHTL
jgi:hypothetical protein